MNILLVGSDLAKANAYRRAAAYLGDCSIIGQLGADELSGCEARPGLAVIALEQADERMIDFLLRAGAKAIYDPPYFDAALRLREISNLLAGAGLCMLPLLPLRLLPVAQLIREQLVAGSLGRLFYLKLSYNERLPASGAVAGALAQRGAGAFDLLRWLLGVEIADVWLTRGRLAQADEGIVILSLALADDSYATVDLSWSLPASYPKPAAITLEIAGSGGSIRSDLLNQNAMLYSADTAQCLNWGSDWHIEVLRALADLNAGKPPSFSLEDLALAQAQVEALA